MDPNISKKEETGEKRKSESEEKGTDKTAGQEVELPEGKAAKMSEGIGAGVPEGEAGNMKVLETAWKMKEKKSEEGRPQNKEGECMSESGARKRRSSSRSGNSEDVINDRLMAKSKLRIVEKASPDIDCTEAQLFVRGKFPTPSVEFLVEAPPPPLPINLDNTSETLCSHQQSENIDPETGHCNMCHSHPAPVPRSSENDPIQTSSSLSWYRNQSPRTSEHRTATQGTSAPVQTLGEAQQSEVSFESVTADPLVLDLQPHPSRTTTPFKIPSGVASKRSYTGDTKLNLKPPIEAILSSSSSNYSFESKSLSLPSSSSSKPLILSGSPTSSLFLSAPSENLAASTSLKVTVQRMPDLGSLASFAGSSFESEVAFESGTAPRVLDLTPHPSRTTKPFKIPSGVASKSSYTGDTKLNLEPPIEAILSSSSSNYSLESKSLSLPSSSSSKPLILSGSPASSLFRSAPSENLAASTSLKVIVQRMPDPGTLASFAGSFGCGANESPVTSQWRNSNFSSASPKRKLEEDLSMTKSSSVDSVRSKTSINLGKSSESLIELVAGPSNDHDNHSSGGDSGSWSEPEETKMDKLAEQLNDIALPGHLGLQTSSPHPLSAELRQALSILKEAAEVIDGRAHDGGIDENFMEPHLQELIAFVIREHVINEFDIECSGLLLHLAARYGHMEFLDFLLSEKAMKETRNPFGLTPLHTAIMFRQTGAIVCLLERGANVNTSDSTGIRPIHVAAAQGDVGTILFLLQMGSLFETATCYGETPLLIAERSGQTEAVGIFQQIAHVFAMLVNEPPSLVLGLLRHIKEDSPLLFRAMMSAKCDDNANNLFDLAAKLRIDVFIHGLIELLSDKQNNNEENT